MSVYLVKYDHGKKLALPVTREEYIQLRSAPQHLRYLEQARGGNKEAKLKLTQFIYGGHFKDGVVKGSKLPSNTCGFDVDNPDDYQRVSQMVKANPEAYGVMGWERSVGQGGHFFLLRKSGQTILERQVEFAIATRCEMDTNAHDTTRVLFATSASAEDLPYLSDALFDNAFDLAQVEAEAQMLHQRETEGTEQVPAEAHKAHKHYKPWVDQPNGVKHPEPTEADQADQEHPTPMLYDDYNGLPYDELLQTYWELHYEGRPPSKGDRNSLTYEAAYQFRNICGNSREQLDKVIPCYDGLSHAEKMQCIDSALAARPTSIPKKMREVIEVVKRRHVEDAEVLGKLEEVQSFDESHYANMLPRTTPMGVSDSLASVPSNMAMAVLIAICPAIGALATGVKLTVHGVPNTLNLISFIIGEFSSGKGMLDPIINAWMSEIIAQDKLLLEREMKNREERRQAKNKKEQPPTLIIPLRFITFNNTLANLTDRLAHTEGKHAFSFTPEADMLAAKWRSQSIDLSILLRHAYDASPLSREAKSLEAVAVHIDALKWNAVLAGTPDSLTRVITSYTDGLASRICIGRTPDNTFAPLSKKVYGLNDHRTARIEQVAHLLTLMEGTMNLNKVEERAQAWLERVRLETLKDDDRVKARLRMRTCISAQRMTGCLVLCAVAEKLIKTYGYQVAETKLKSDATLWKEMAEKLQTPSILRCFDVMVDYLLENAELYFHDRIESAMSNTNYISPQRSHKNGKNSTIFERLGAQFTIQEAYYIAVSVKGSNVTNNTVRQMLKNWKNQGLVENIDVGKYRKI